MEQLINVISKFVGLKPDEIKKKILNDEGNINDIAESYLSDLLKSKLDKVSFSDEKQKDIADNFYSKGKKETFEEITEKLVSVFPSAEITKDDKFDEIINKLKSQKIEILSDDKIKLHPLYRKLETETISKAEYEKLLTDFENYKKSEAQKQTLSNIQKYTLDYLESNEYKLPEDAKARDRRLQAYLKDNFVNADFQPEKDDFILLENGKRKEDEFGNPITAKKLIEDTVGLFFDKKVKASPTSVNDPAPNNDDKPSTLKMPNSIEDYNKQRSLLSGKELLEYVEKAEKHLKDKGVI